MFKILPNLPDNCTQFLVMCSHSVNFHTFQRTDEQGTTENVFPTNHFNPSNAPLNPICHLLALFKSKGHPCTGTEALYSPYGT